MLPIEIHDRGRGPELRGTRITVYDIIPYRLGGRTANEIAEIFLAGYPDLTAAHIEALFRYMDEHYDEVMAVHRKIEERIPRKPAVGGGEAERESGHDRGTAGGVPAPPGTNGRRTDHRSGRFVGCQGPLWGRRRTGPW